MTDEFIYKSISEELANNSEEDFKPLTGKLSFNVAEGYIRDGIYVGDDMYIEGDDYEDLF